MPDRHDEASRSDRIEALERRVDELDAFAYCAAHELRGPLHAIAGFARLVEEHDGPAMSPAGRARLRRVIDGAAQLDAVVEGLLVLAGAGHQPLRREPVDTSRLVRDIVGDLRFLYPGTQVIVDALPVLDADPVLARQVFLNVVGNAFKYSSLAAEPAVTIGTDGDGHLVVQDNGVGFGPEQAARLFAPFERFAGRAYPGTGVGLAVAQRILHRHGGWIRATSRPGGPTTFTFSFGGSPGN